MAVISTNGWDTVFATTYTTINSQIVAQWPAMIATTPTLGQINATLSNHKASISLTTSAWQLTQGGSGSIVRMILPITSGTMSGIDDDYDLSGQNIVIELSLQWVPQPNQVQFAIDNNVSTIIKQLQANTTVTSDIVQAFASDKVTLSPSSTVTIITNNVCWKIVDSSSNMSFYLYVTNVGGAASLIEVYQYVNNSLVVAPKSNITPVTVISAGSISDPIDGPIFRELVSQNIDENLAEFEFIFASVDVVTQLAQDDVWAWLQPTSNEYAVVEPLKDPNNDNSVFAILSMVNNNINPKPVLQVDENAVAPGCSSSLLISPAMFLQNMLFPGATTIFTGSSPDDFTIDEKNLSFTNNKTVKWAECQLDDKTQVSLSVAPGNFSMGIENERVNLSFSNLNYPIKKVDLTMGHVDIIFDGHFELVLKTGSNGNKTLWFDIPADQNEVTDVTAVMTKTFYTVEEAMGIVTAALSAISIVGAVGNKIATSAATKILEDGGIVETEASAAEIKAAFNRYLTDSVTRMEFLDNAGSGALDMMQAALVNISQANLWSSIAKWAAFAAALTGVAFGGMMTIEAVLEQANKHAWDKTPAFSKFADLTIAQYGFAGLTNLQVESAALAESMQLGFIEPGPKR